jgi:hypothetical protein
MHYNTTVLLFLKIFNKWCTASITFPNNINGLRLPDQITTKKEDTLILSYSCISLVSCYQIVRPLSIVSFTGISSNRWTCLFILIGSGNLYPVLLDSVVVSAVVPNTLPEVTHKHNLEPSLIAKCSISR